MPPGHPGSNNNMPPGGGMPGRGDPCGMGGGGHDPRTRFPYCVKGWPGWNDRLSILCPILDPKVDKGAAGNISESI
eukprot:scaffold15933_cov36-Phaeocystis_antarctica.AAC.1